MHLVWNEGHVGSSCGGWGGRFGCMENIDMAIIFEMSTSFSWDPLSELDTLPHIFLG